MRSPGPFHAIDSRAAFEPMDCAKGLIHPSDVVQWVMEVRQGAPGSVYMVSTPRTNSFPM